MKKASEEEPINLPSNRGSIFNESTNTINKSSTNDALLLHSASSLSSRYIPKPISQSKPQLELKRKDISDKSIQTKKTLISNAITNKFQSNDNDLNRILKKVERLCNSDDENENESDEEDNESSNHPNRTSNTKCSCLTLVLNTNIYLKLWSYIISINFFFICFITPYEVAFLNETNYDIFEILSTIILFIDIIINFFSTTADNRKSSLKSNIKRYLTTWFLTDILGVFPFFIVIPDHNKNSIRILTNLPKLLRLLKLIQNRNIQRCLNSLVEKLKLKINYQRCFILLFVFAFLNHLCACLFYTIAKFENFDPATWVYAQGYLDKSEVQLYFISLYWTLTTVTTVGYGDVHAVCYLEKIYTVIIISIGVVMYSFFIGTLSVIISAINEQQSELNEKLGYVNQIQRVFDITDEIYEKVKRAVKFGTNKVQIDNKMLLQTLPIKLRLELSRVLNDKMMQNFIFFRGKSEEFYVHASPLLKAYMYYQNDYLFEPKAQIEDMFFIGKGTVVYCLPKKYDEREVRTLKKNWNFGEIEMCTGQSINYSIRIKSRMAELYMLKKTDFISLSVNFQNYIEEFLEHSLIIYKEFKERYYRLIHECNELEMRVTDYQIKISKEILETSRQSSDPDRVSKGDEPNPYSNSNSNTNDKALNRKRLSKNTMKMISYIKLEDQRINAMIDSLLASMKEKNMVFPASNGTNPYQMLEKVKFETNIETKLNTLNQIEDIVKGY